MASCVLRRYGLLVTFVIIRTLVVCVKMPLQVSSVFKSTMCNFIAAIFVGSIIDSYVFASATTETVGF